MIHELKCWNPHFDQIVEGTKTFELRKADRPFQSGDKLLLKLYDPVVGVYAGSEVLVDVLGVSKKLEKFGLPSDLCIMSIKRIDEPARPLCGPDIGSDGELWAVPC